MKSRQSQYTHLPNIERLHTNPNQKGQSIYERKSNFLSPKNNPRQSQIFKLLQQVRKSVQSSLSNQQSIEKKTKKKQQNEKKRQNYLVKKQRKIYYMQTQPADQNEPQTPRRLTNFVSNSVQVQEIESLEKPPHRTKMAMCIQSDKLYIYGGLGCEPNLKLGVFDLKNKRWIFSGHQNFAEYHPTNPLIGHTFGSYKGKGYIFGGSSNDCINELSIVNFQNLKFKEGQHCQYRRKNHAMAMISKFMVIHGGIQSNQVTNTMYFYNTETNTWTYPFVSSTLPYLANHGMACTYPFKTKKKQILSLNQLEDPIFMFGGQDKEGKLCNTMYKIQFQNQIFISTKITLNNEPSRRAQMCFQYMGNNTILLYGGKFDINEQPQSKQEDFTNQLYSFNTDKYQWTELSTSNLLPDRYGMASAASQGKVFIFGGFIGNKYANADVTKLTVWNQDLRKSKSNFGTRVFSCEKYC